jgi:spermidine synthase
LTLADKPNPERVRKVRPTSGTFQHVILDMETKLARTLKSNTAERMIREAAHHGNLKVVTMSSHSFGPNAFTTFALLSQSHIALHTWPELDYIACDAFSCGGDLAPVVRTILKRLEPVTVRTRFFPRGVRSRPKLNTIFVDDTGPNIRTILDVSLVEELESKFQTIQVFKHTQFGKILAINGDIQFAEKDHTIYDEAILSPLRRLKSLENVLIVGGGDGLCCTYLVEHKIGSKIGVLELDPAVGEVCLRQFRTLSHGLLDRRVTVTFGDAASTIRNLPDRHYDAVVIDTTAPDTKWGYGTYSPKFLKECKRVLRFGGILSMNGTSQWYDYNLDFQDIGRAVGSVFGNVRMTTAWIPSFGSPWAFFSARKRGLSK